MVGEEGSVVMTSQVSVSLNGQCPVKAANLQDPVANIKSQIKRIGTNEKRRARNKAAKSEVKTRIKSANVAVEAGEEGAPEDLRMAVKKLDKAAARGIIHRNQAANRKSSLMRQAARRAAAATSGAPGDAG
jgi:small subunit ribosomal protein S20